MGLRHLWVVTLVCAEKELLRVLNRFGLIIWGPGFWQGSRSIFPRLSILLIAGVTQLHIPHDSTSRLFRPEYSIGHRDQKGDSAGSANAAGCRLPLSGRSQKLRGEKKWGNFKIRVFTVFRPKYKAGHRDWKWCLHQSTPEYWIHFSRIFQETFQRP